MGKPKKQDKRFSYSAPLESRIPANPYLRKITEVSDLSFVSSAVKEFYGYNGNSRESRASTKPQNRPEPRSGGT